MVVARPLLSQKEAALLEPSEGDRTRLSKSDAAQSESMVARIFGQADAAREAGKICQPLKATQKNKVTAATLWFLKSRWLKRLVCHFGDNTPMEHRSSPPRNDENLEPLWPVKTGAEQA
ncbi:hypothetical protein [Algimonas ampicilliniresistens]|uniref:hypothetical protein n=1 Tax=Algimonas ampicilliniresistens TaxID=1298735 RepID=UPI0024E084CC|nr:hypothetical protein [Algimonas ampicilliniresistens]